MAWYRRAALQGDVHAQFRLGFLYAYGRGVDRDDMQAADWYGRAAAQGNRAAQAALDELRAEGRLPTPGGSRDALLLRSAADRGGATAQYQLGVRYATGEGVPQDAQQAVYWYRLAAEQGIAPAQYQLGLRYANGDGVTRDYAEAVKWYRRAAEQGVAFAQFNLGVRYVNGQGVARDPVQAYQWFSVAAQSLLGREADTARQARDSVKAQLTPEQLARGRGAGAELAREAGADRRAGRYASKVMSWAPSQQRSRPTSGKLRAALLDREEVVAGQRAVHAREARGAVREQDLGLADPGGIEEQRAGRGLARRVLRAHPQVEVAERDPARLAAPARLDDPLPVGQEAAEGGAGARRLGLLPSRGEGQRPQPDAERAHAG